MSSETKLVKNRAPRFTTSYAFSVIISCVYIDNAVVICNKKYTKYILSFVVVLYIKL